MRFRPVGAVKLRSSMTLFEAVAAEYQSVRQGHGNIP
jgi:hypothetical protein